MCSLGGTRSSTLCKGDEDNVLPRYRPFYATEKGITGRRAHNPIHPGKRKRSLQAADQCRCPSLLCMEKVRRLQPP
ncbi:hypothetical protein QC53_11615 [Salmonella enterica subsp. enterica serovar Newport]|nr:hypothetical protein [Salmonella enterica subsp. enterica serovar Newport]